MTQSRHIPTWLTVSGLLIGTVLLSALPAPAFADAFEDCDKAKDPDKQIKGCNEVIEWIESQPPKRGQTEEKVRNDREFLGALYSRRAGAYRRKSEYEQALVDLESSRNLRPDNPGVHAHMGITWYHLEQYEKAIELLGQAIRLNSQEQYYYHHRGKAFYRLEKYRRALADFNRALKLDPDWVDSYLYRGFTHRSMKQYKRAVSDFTGYAYLRPKDSQGYAHRGLVYQKLSKPRKALADFTKSIALAPPYHLFAYREKAKLHAQFGEYQQTIKSYEDGYFSIVVERGKKRFVRKLQQRLSEAGLYQGKADGRYTGELRSAWLKCLRRKCKWD